MLKKILLTPFIFFFLTTYASYLKNVPQTLTQPNGRVIHCFASGDEYHNWLHDSAGYTIILNPQTGYYTYAIKTGDALQASTHIVGEVNPAFLGLEPHINLSAEQWLEKRQSIQALIPDEPHRKTSGKNHGIINNLVFFLRFSDENDQSYGTTFSTMLNRFNDSSSHTSNSLYNYYRQAAYGKLSVISHLYPTSNNNIIYSFQDSFPRVYYLAYDSIQNPLGYKNSSQRRYREHTLLQRAILFFQDSIPEALDLDYNDDGNIDNICFVTSGSPAGWSDLLWPHRWSLSSFDVYINNKRVYDYNFIMETYMYSGIITHEFMHTLGAPDLYRYESSPITPVGPWDLMASTNYSKPQGLGTYMKWKYGNWIDSIPTIYQEGTYTLYPANGNRQDQIGYKIPIAESENQFLVLEYRQQSSSTFESAIPNSGLLIYRIDTRFNGNASYNGSTRFDEVYLFRPGGTFSSQGTLSQAHFSEESGRTVFNETSNPAPFFTDGSGIEGIMISNITRAIDSIQFTIGIDTTVLFLDKYTLQLENELNYIDSFSISSNDSWYIICDTTLIRLSATQGNGNETIYISVKELNPTTINMETELSVCGSSRIKRLLIKQKPIRINDCVIISNLFDSDTLVEKSFPYSSTNNYVNAASEYFSLTDEISVDSLSIYFGSLNLSDNDSVIVRFTNTNSLRTPTTLLKKLFIYGHQIQNNAWNTLVLDERLKIDNSFSVDYMLPGSPDSVGSAIFVLAKNRAIRNSSLSTNFLKVNNFWQESKSYLNDNTYYSLPVRVYACPFGMSINAHTLKNTTDIRLYPNPAKDMIHVDVQNTTSARVDYILYTVSGQRISSYVNRNPSETLSISLSSLSSGMYFLKITGTDFSNVTSFIVE